MLLLGLGFDPWQINVRFVVDNVALVQIFSQSFYPISVSFHQPSIFIHLSVSDLYNGSN